MVPNFIDLSGFERVPRKFMKSFFALFSVGLCVLPTLASPIDEHDLKKIKADNININDYRQAPDGTPRYFLVRGIMCQAVWECDGLLRCTVGNTGLETENGKPYFSPLLWALLDYEQCTSKQRTPGKLETPLIQGNTPQQARELVIRLIQENTNNCVNDSLGRYLTPLMVANPDDDLILLLLEKGADPNKAKYMNGTTLLYLAAERGSVEVVKSLLFHGANPTFEFNPYLKSILSEYYIAGQDDFNKLKCLALIAEAQTRWKQ